MSIWAKPTREQLVTKVIDGILAREGGFVDHPLDKGGPTNFGITIGTLSAWRSVPVTKAQVQALSVLEARNIYRAVYIERPGFLSIDCPELFELLVDVAVNAGPTRAIEFLQRALGVKVDGVFGPVTRDAGTQADSGAVYRKVAAERIRHYGRIITGSPSQAVFAAGWMARAAEFVERGV